MRQISAGTKPRLIKNVVPEANDMIETDIYNMAAKLRRDLRQDSAMSAIYTKLKHYGYMTRYLVSNDGTQQLEHLYFMHPRSRES